MQMATKIIKIKVQNLKAVKEAELNLKGCTAIITGANNSGKSSILKSLIDRIQSKKPELIVKQGEKNGLYEMELSDGCKIIWKFSEKSDAINYITKEGFAIKTGVIEQLQNKYLGGKKTFDIDKFLQIGAKEQEKMLCKNLDIDLTQIDVEYKSAYEDRTQANNLLKTLQLQKNELPEEIDAPDVEKLKIKKTAIEKSINEKMQTIRDANDQVKNNWLFMNEHEKDEVERFNKEQSDIDNAKKSAINSKFIIENELKKLHAIGFDFIEITTLNNFVSSLPEALPKKIFQKLPEPEYQKIEIDNSELVEINNQIDIAQKQAVKYAINQQIISNYNNWLEQVQKAKETAAKYDAKVKEIELRKQEIIKSANLPEHFTFNENGLLYKGFELNRQSQSSSALYIAGLKLATMNLGELKTVHFDASFLDKNSLQEVQNFANTLDLQLLIERPDYNAGEIQYQIIENNETI